MACATPWAMSGESGSPRLRHWRKALNTSRGSRSRMVRSLKVLQPKKRLTFIWSSRWISEPFTACTLVMDPPRGMENQKPRPRPGVASKNLAQIEFILREPLRFSTHFCFNDWDAL